jgi:hypothetical protein
VAVASLRAIRFFGKQHGADRYLTFWVTESRIAATAYDGIGRTGKRKSRSALVPVGSCRPSPAPPTDPPAVLISEIRVIRCSIAPK